MTSSSPRPRSPREVSTSLARLTELASTLRVIGPGWEPLLRERHLAIYVGNFMLAVGGMGTIMIGLVVLVTGKGYSAAAVCIVTAFVGWSLRTAFRVTSWKRSREELAGAALVLGKILRRRGMPADPEQTGNRVAVAYTVDARRRLDARWLTETADRVDAQTDVEIDTPFFSRGPVTHAQSREMLDELLPTDLTDGVELRCTTMWIPRARLPDQELPEDGLLVLVIRGRRIDVLPAEAWTLPARAR